MFNSVSWKIKWPLYVVLLMGIGTTLTYSGCKAATTNTTPQALAPGYLNQADQVMGQTLVGAHAFYTTIQQDVASGKYTPSSTEKVALNNFATALNAAQLIYIGYHAGANTQAQAQAAVNALSTQQTALQSFVAGGTK